MHKHCDKDETPKCVRPNAKNIKEILSQKYTVPRQQRPSNKISALIFSVFFPTYNGPIIIVNGVQSGQSQILCML